MAPRYALLYSILACMVAWQLAACAVAPERKILASFNDCAGEVRSLPVTRIETYCVPCVCGSIAAERGGEWWQVALMTVGLPVACSIWDNARTWGVIVLPPSPWEWIEAHEWQHIAFGETHPALLPLLDVGCPGKYGNNSAEFAPSP